MEWLEAIAKSKKGTCNRVVEENGFTSTIIRYKDGSAFNLVSSNGKVDYFLSRPAQDFEKNGFTDWQPSI